MIVRDRPNPIALLIALRGSVVPDILPHILLVALFASAMTLVSQYHVLDVSHYTVMPVTLLGIVLSILLSFRNNAAYDRWWEARKQWGQMVYEIRSLARTSGTLLGNKESGNEESDNDEPCRRELLGLILAYAHALRGQLREEDVREQHVRSCPLRGQLAEAPLHEVPLGVRLRAAELRSEKKYRPVAESRTTAPP